MERIIDRNLPDQYKVLLGKTEAARYHVPRLDETTRATLSIPVSHHEIHDGRSFSAYYTVTTGAANNHRSGLYLKTPVIRAVHAVVSFSASTAANFSICEAPTITADTGTGRRGE